MSMYKIKLEKFSVPYIGSQNNVIDVFKLGTFDLFGHIAAMESFGSNSRLVTQVYAYVGNNKWAHLMLDRACIAIVRGELLYEYYKSEARL